jgi:hypothetical protein
MWKAAARVGIVALGAILAGRADPVGAEELTELTLRPHARVLGVQIGATASGAELVIASSDGGTPAQRFLTMYVLRDGQLRQVRQQRVPDDVVAWTLGDFGGGRRPVYLTARSVFALSEQSDAPRLLVRDTRLLFATPQPGELPFWDGAVDLDGDRRDDLVLPDATGYRVYRHQAGGELAAAGRIDIDYEFETGSDGKQDARASGVLPPFVSARSLRRLAPADLDADARIDLLALRDERLFAFLQSAAGQFGAAPSWERSFARSKTLGSTRMGDANRDGRADVVVTETDTRELVTRLRIFLADAQGLPEQPTQILKLSGLSDDAELVDVDRDGLQDLAVLSFDKGFLQALAAGKVSFSYQVFRFRADEGRFASAPDLDFETTLDVSLEPDDDKKGPALARMLGDFDGDGLCDLVIVSNDQLRIHRVKRNGSRLEVDASAAWTRKVTVENVFAGDLDASGRPEIVVRYADAVDVLVVP